MGSYRARLTEAAVQRFAGRISARERAQRASHQHSALPGPQGRSLIARIPKGAPMSDWPLSGVGSGVGVEGAELSDEQIDVLRRHGTERDVAAGDVLFRPGDD